MWKTLLFSIFVALSATSKAIDVASSNFVESGVFGGKGETVLKVYPGQYLGSVVQSNSQPTADWLFPVEGKAGNLVVEEGFSPPAFDQNSYSDFSALQLNNATNVISPVHVTLRQFPSAYHPLLFILGSTRCSVAPTPHSSPKLQSRVALLLNVKEETCSRQSAQVRMNLVRSLAQFFSTRPADYWWLAASPAITDVRLSKMVMSMLEGVGSIKPLPEDLTQCTLVLPIGCGARVPGNYIDNVVKLQDDFTSFPSEVREAVLRWSVKIYDPLMLPKISINEELKKGSGSRLLMRNSRNRHRRQAFGLSRTRFLDSYQFSDYMNDESWALENRLAYDASSGFGIEQSPIATDQSSDVFDRLTMVQLTTPSMSSRSSSKVVPLTRFDDGYYYQSTPVASYSSIAANDDDDDVEKPEPVASEAPGLQEVNTPSAVIMKNEDNKNFPSLATSTEPPPFPPYVEDSLFITEHKILSYPVRRKFEDLADSPDEITFILNKCRSPSNGESVSQACQSQALSTDDWLYFNYRTQSLEGIVPTTEEGVQIFNLTGISFLRAKSFIIRIAISPSSKNPQIADRTHEFCVELSQKRPIQSNNDDVPGSITRMREQIEIVNVIKKLRENAGDDVVVLGVNYATDSQFFERFLASMCFSHMTLTPVDGRKYCPFSEFAGSLGRLVQLPATWRAGDRNFAKYLPSPLLSSAIDNGTNYRVTLVSVGFLNACSARFDMNKILNETIKATDRSDAGDAESSTRDVWLTLVIPGLVLLCMLLLALIIACVLYRCIRKKSRSKSRSKQSRVSVALGNGNSVYLTKGAPAIFQEELDSEMPGPPTRLLIAADDRRDQFSGGEISDRDGEDTVSSSAPGGSPGRLHSSEPNVRGRMVPATPPPPEYRMHQQRNTAAIVLQQSSMGRHDDASSPESRDLAEEMSELSRPLLVQKTTIQTLGTVA